MSASTEDHIVKIDELGISNLPANLPYSSYIKDDKGIYLYSNPFQLKLFGLKKIEDLQGVTDFDLCVKQYEATQLRQHDQQTLISKTKCIFTEEVTFTDGKMLHALSIKLPYQSASKKVIGVQGISFVIESQKNILIDPISFKIDKNKISLTRIQSDCLYYLAKGMTYKQIAEKMELSWRTVAHYIDAIKFKLHCEKRSELIQKALTLDFIKSRLLNS